MAVALAVSGLLPAGPARAQEPPPDEPFARLDTLDVSVGSRLLRESWTQVVTAETLKELPAVNVEEALRWALGVDLQPRSPAQADLSIRGSTFEQVLVLVDGVRMSDPQTGHFDLNLAVPLEQVERIEILRGPASAVHGADALGGVIHIVTRDGAATDGATGSARLQGGSFGQYALAVDGGVSSGPWRLTVAASRDGADGHRDGTDHRATRVHARATAPLAGGRLSLDAGHTRRDFGADGFYAPFPSYEESRMTTATLRWQGRLGSGVFVEPRVSYRGHDDDFILRRGDPAFYRNLHDSRQITAELQGRVALGGWAALAVGGSWIREELESSNLGDRRQDWRSAFAEVVARGGPGTLQVGVRLDDRTDAGTFVSPTVSASTPLTAGFSLRAAAGRAFRAPTWTERYYVDPANVGTPDLGVERGWSGEVGVERRLGATGSMAVTGFLREIEDLIDWARPAGAGEVPWETRNVERATTRGVEVSLEDVPLGPVRLSAGAAWLDLDTREAGGFVSKSALRPIHRDLNLALALPLPMGFSARTLLRDRTRVGEGRGTTLDLRLQTELGPTTLFLDATNLGDATFPDITGLPVPGRALGVGLRMPLGPSGG